MNTPLLRNYGSEELVQAGNDTLLGRTLRPSEIELSNRVQKRIKNNNNLENMLIKKVKASGNTISNNSNDRYIVISDIDDLDKEVDNLSYDQLKSAILTLKAKQKSEHASDMMIKAQHDEELKSALEEVSDNPEKYNMIKTTVLGLCDVSLMALNISQVITGVKAFHVPEQKAIVALASTSICLQFLIFLLLLAVLYLHSSDLSKDKTDKDKQKVPPKNSAAVNKVIMISFVMLFLSILVNITISALQPLAQVK
ncbi:guanylate kinase [Acrasis kona]|uniref:Guanylate kinase n=1 Tax=Acrasis kona TaxID=1008807 RepID=A0AAW2Z6P7_9EUKA